MEVDSDSYDCTRIESNKFTSTGQVLQIIRGASEPEQDALRHLPVEHVNRAQQPCPVGRPGATAYSSIKLTALYNVMAYIVMTLYMTL